MYWKELEKEPTADLIGLIQQKGDKNRSEAAFVTFTFRFNKEIIDICRKVAKKWNYDNDVADLMAERAFERFWKYPGGFKEEKCKELEIDRCVVFYLLRTARNCFFDYHAQQTGIKQSPYSGNEDVVVSFPDLEAFDIPADRLEGIVILQNRMEKALGRLSPKHKTIYLTYKAYEKEGYKLPRILLQKLRTELSLSQNSIRVYKNEAFQAIEQLNQIK